MSFTFTEIQDRVLSITGFSEIDRARVGEAINMAVRDVWGARRWRWRESIVAVATATSVNTTAFPYASSHDLQSLVPTSVTMRDARAPVYVDETLDDPRFRDYQDAASTRGMPEAFTIRDELIVWYPWPDAVYNFNAVVFAQPTTPLSGTNTFTPMPDEFLDAVVFRAAELAHFRGRDWDSAAQLNGQYAQELRNLSKMDRDVARTGPRRMQMPAVYGNTYGGR